MWRDSKFSPNITRKNRKRKIYFILNLSALLHLRHHLVQIDAAHKMGCEKLDKATVKLRAFQVCFVYLVRFVGYFSAYKFLLKT